MPSIEPYREKVAQLMRWHGECNHSVGEKVRLLERYRHLTDIEALDLPITPTLAREIVAVEAGFASWEALRAGAEDVEPRSVAATGEPRLLGAIPILFVRDVAAAADFYTAKLGCRVDFLHGRPPFYGSVSRDGLCLHLRLVHRPNFAELAGREPSLILASIEVTDVKALFEDCVARDAEIAQPLTAHPWGGTDFHLRDPDGNVLSFVQYR